MAAEVKVPSHRLYGVSFRPYTRHEIKSLSVKEITNPVSHNMLQNSTFGGLYDLALGSGERNDICSTCRQPPHNCPGHLGHISLPLPVFNPVTFKTMLSLLKWMCFDCDQLLAPRAASYLFSCQMTALSKGLLITSHDLEQIYRNFIVENGSDNQLDDNAFEILKGKLDACLNSACKEARQVYLDSSIEIRNVVECRTQVYKDFVLKHKSSSGLCRYCRKPLRSLRSESMSRIFFGARLKAKQIKNLQKKLLKEKYGNLEADDIADIPEDDSANKIVESDGKPNADQAILTPAAARDHLRQLWKNNREVVQWIIGVFHSGLVDVTDDHPTDVFFIEDLIVPPSKFRPAAKMNGRLHDNPQTVNLASVIKESTLLKDLLNKHLAATMTTELQTQITEEPSNSLAKIHQQWVTLQYWVNSTIDSSLGKMLKDVRPGIKQILERKQGMFRKFMMGKRVNFAARSVISPDPCIATNEVGVPEIFAKRLTYSEPVTPWNFQELRKAVINGPNFYPGALFIEDADGSKIMLTKDKLQREAQANQLLTQSKECANIDGNKKVHRHIKTGDIVIMNRQPTLHRPSMQAHKVRILKTEKTLRMNYSNCKAYNADFDGDEMNMHFPQSELARSESYNLACADHQYLVPKDGTPLAGLIQDHVVAGVLLMVRGQFFTRAQYHQFVFSSLTDSRTQIKTLPPAIIKPRQLWSGKQVFSTLLLNLIPEGKAPVSLVGEAKVKEKTWQNGPLVGWLEKKYRDGIENMDWAKESGHDKNLNSLRTMDSKRLKGIFERMSESQVVIHHGELLVGVLDKNHYGPTPFSLVHCCYELYGGEMAGRLLTCLERLFTGFLQTHGFTLGVMDILVTKSGNKKRRHLMKKCKSSGHSVAMKTFNVEARGAREEECDLTELIRQAHFSKDKSDWQQFDAAMKASNDQYQNEITKACMPSGLRRQFPRNGLQLMVLSGAKGSMVNCMQISCLLGQIDLEGQRPPLMLSGRSLPTFVPYDVSPRAGGFVDGRFLTGISAPEYYFHCMAGREGLVDTAVKTSRSGYLQRCLIKHMEGLAVKYDGTVRDSDGSVMQFYYGEDGLDILKTSFLNKHQFPFLISNHTAIVTKNLLSEIKSKMDTQKCTQLQTKMQEWKERNAGKDTKARLSPFLEYSKGRWSKFIDERNLDGSQYVAVDGSEYVDHAEFKKKLIRRYQKRVAENPDRYSIKDNHFPDPVISVLRPDRYFGCVSENFQKLIDEYVEKNPHNLLSRSKKSKKAREIGLLVPVSRFCDLLHLKYLQSLVHPGEAVGLLAAQSIGEPSTQMTLNTFHFAGRGDMNVTLGIPRLREILMTASASIKTPMMEVPLKNCQSETVERGNRLKNRLTRVYLSQVIESVDVKSYWSLKKHGHKNRCYNVRINFLPYSQYCGEISVTPQKILSVIENKFLSTLSGAIEKAAKEPKGKSVEITRETNQNNPAGERAAVADDDADDVLDDDMNDDDEQAKRSRGRQQQERDYEGEEEEREEMGERESDQESENDSDGEAIGQGDDDEVGEQEKSDDLNAESLDVDNDESSGQKHKKRRKQMDDSRINRLLSSIAPLTEYKYDADNELWCEATFNCRHTSQEFDITSLVERELKKAVISQVSGITRCLLVEEKSGAAKSQLLRMEGVNIHELYKYDKILNLNEFYTNDIHAMANHYGIEAARSVIIKEIRDVFAAYGIGVDYRHLSLVADYMTFEGRYRAFNRMGLESHSSPFQKMTFETTMMFLRNSIVEGSIDSLNSPSARIVTGRVIGEGTGCFDLVVPVS